VADKIALVYWPDTTGHAARSIPIAKEVESRGHDLIMAGGGFGSRFVEMNGFELQGFAEFEMLPDSKSKLGLIKHTLADTLPKALKRFRQLFGWLRREKPDKVVTDDMLCLICAFVLRIEVYRIENWTPQMFGFPLSSLYSLYDRLTLTFGDKIVLTSLWPWEEAREGVERSGPLAQEGSEQVDQYDVLLMPGSFGEEFGEIRSELEENGYKVKMVGADDWDTKASMTPQTKAAECTVCCGFSSIADSVVGGTHCIVYPHLFLQQGIARSIEERDLNGLEVAHTKDEVLKAAKRCVDSSCAQPDYENGAEEFVNAIE
jgi:hypothetical protein